MTLVEYIRTSRRPRYTVLFALPLLLLYEGLVLLLEPAGAGPRNGADVLLRSLFGLLGGAHGLMLFNLVLFGTGGWLVLRDWRRNPARLRLTLFPAMLAESLLLAVLVGVVVGRLTSGLLGLLALSDMPAFSFPQQIMLSLGAGLYEELVFRVLLVGGLALLFTRTLKWSSRRAGVAATVVGALIFSAFHYIGPYAYHLDLPSFLFRAIAGMVFSAIYLVRGFGIAAWTHALYDVLLSL